MDRTERKTNSRNHSVTIDRDSKMILRKIILDFLILFCVGFLILVFFLWGKPYERGFFCDDESLKHPYKDSTVTNLMLYIIGLGLPVLTMCLTEWIRLRDDKARRPRALFGRELPAWLWESYQVVGVFLFGCACQQLTTDVAKYSIGRLRPHFFDMKWKRTGGMGIQLAAAVFWMLPLITSSTGDIRHHGASRARGWRAGTQQTVEAAANNSVSNITAQLGGTAYLHCLVGHLSERGQVSWIRKRDWHILSSGKFTYTNDERFQVLHGEGSEDWTLQIKFVQKRDNGTYECQVSTRTGIVSHYVRLQIVVPEAFILGSGEHHVDLGSVIHLICIVEKSPTPPQYVFWYHNDRMINYDATRGGITVETEPGARTQSRLTVRGATLKDSGNYTCSASNTEPASIHVFVSEGSNKMAAILRRNTSAIHGITTSATCLLLLGTALMHYGLR